jgi:hypothetical protein
MKLAGSVFTGRVFSLNFNLSLPFSELAGEDSAGLNGVTTSWISIILFICLETDLGEL